MAIEVYTPSARRRVDRLDAIWEERPGLVGWLTTVNHKRIGLLYFFTSLAFFLAGGVEALLIRTQLAAPELHVVGPSAFDQLFTVHGVTMIFLFVIPMGIGAFGNYLLPLMIGARDLAFPRLNMLGYWFFLASGCFIYAGLLMGHGPDQGWFSYVPLASREYSPGLGVDVYALGLIFNTMATTATVVNLIVTTFKARAPGMSLNRMPLFCYAQLAVSFVLLFALPALTVDLVFLELERQLGFQFFDPAHGGSNLLWQHLFWIFGHPEVYAIILPAMGIATSIIPAFAQRRMIAFPLVALAELLVGFIGFGVWAHHMFAVGMPTATAVFFAGATLMVVIPSTIQIFAWMTTVAMGTPEFRTPLLFIGGFIALFVTGGLSGIMFAAIPLDQALTDTYFVVAHFHFIIFGAAVFPLLGGMFFWFPKVTGRMYHEGLGKVSFWLTFLGTWLTFFPMHILGLLGMTRRVYTYQSGLGWDSYNLVETIGSYVLAAGLVLIAINLGWSLRRGLPAPVNPWNAPTLEWATTSPPPDYNFAVVPYVRSPYPVWDTEDRLDDRRRLEEGTPLVLDEGHEMPATTVRDADLDDILELPAESVWPLLVALPVTVVFVWLLTGHYVAAGAFGVVALLALAGWHSQEPQDA
jgi:cytochrome c oxidase subunit I+III